MGIAYKKTRSQESGRVALLAAFSHRRAGILFTAAVGGDGAMKHKNAKQVAGVDCGSFARLLEINAASALGLAFLGLPLTAMAAAIVGDYTQTSGTVTADAIYLGLPPVASQTATISGTSTVLILNGTNNRLGVGEQTIGNMTVSNGAYVDAAQLAASCLTNACNSFIGNGAGSTGTLTITGANSRMDTVNSFVVGSTGVFPGFGTPGGTTTATLNITNGGVLNGNYATIAAGPFPGPGNSQNGSERVNASAVVDGATSLWNLVTSTTNGVTAFLTVGRGPNTSGALDLKNGGKLVIDATPNTGAFPGMSIARESGSNGTVQVNGANGGSSITIKGNSGILNVAGSSASNNGTALLQVTSGGVISGGGGPNDLAGLNVGGGSATSGNGTVLIDGTGSRISLSGVFGPGTGGSEGGGAFANIGRGSGSGSVTVSGGGALTIDTTGSPITNASGQPGINVGRDAASTGSLTITGGTSRVVVTSDSLSPFMAVGRGGIGALNISAGGLLQLNGNGQSTVAAPNSNQLFIGGSGSVAGGTGTATVSGAGSRIELKGTADSAVQVGFGAGSNGSLSVQNGGSVSALVLAIGNSTGTGSLAVNNGTLTLGGIFQGGGSAGSGGGMAIGRGAGSVGTATLTNGAIVNITSDGIEGGIGVGGSRTAAGGTGSLIMSGGSVINLGGNGVGGGLIVGQNSGVGTMTVNGPGTLVNASGYSDGGRVIVASNAAAVGALTVASNALVNAGAVLGVGHDGTASTGGSGTLILSSGGRAEANGIYIGTGGVIAGNGGILAGDVTNDGGIISPGLSPGQLTIEGGYSGAGKFLLEVESDGSGGFLTDSIIFAKVGSVDPVLDFANTEIEFAFLGTTDPEDFFDLLSGSIDTLLGTFFTFSGFSPGTSASLFGSSTFSATSDSYIIDGFALDFDEGTFTVASVSPVPEPATLALAAIGLTALGVARRRKRQPLLA